MTVLTNICYRNILKEVMAEGTDESCRGYQIKEIINYSSSIDMKYPLVTVSARKMGYRFALAEAVHIITGSNLVDNLKPYSKIIENFSDDRVFFSGAYGPKIIDQIEYIGRCFKNDIYSRQAVINIWREKPAVSKDIPCTLSLQYLIRNGGDGLELICIDTMRSSDAWLGIPYDWFSLSMVSAYIAIYLRETVPELKDIKLGEFYLNAGSQHLYVDNKFYDRNKVVTAVSNMDKDFNYEPLSINEFESCGVFVEHLEALRDKNFEHCNHSFLTDELEMFYEQTEQE